MLQKIRIKLFGTRDGLVVYFSVALSIFLTVLCCFIMKPFDDFRDVFAMTLVVGAVSVICGWYMGNRFANHMAYFMPINSKVESTHRKYRKWFKNEKIPKSKSEKVKYLEYLDNLEFLNTQSIKNPMLFIMFTYSTYVFIAGTGFHIIRVLAGILTVVLTLSFLSIKLKLMKIKKVKARLQNA